MTSWFGLDAVGLRSTRTYRTDVYWNREEGLDCLSLRDRPSITSTWEASEEAIRLHLGGRRLEGSHMAIEKNEPSFLTAMRERESWQLSKQLSVQIRGSESVTQPVRCTGRTVTPPQKRGCHSQPLHSDATLTWTLSAECSLRAGTRFHLPLMTNGRALMLVSVWQQLLGPEGTSRRHLVRPVLRNQTAVQYWHPVFIKGTASKKSGSVRSPLNRPSLQHLSNQILWSILLNTAEEKSSQLPSNMNPVRFPFT